MSENNSTLNVTSTPTGYIMSHIGLGSCIYTSFSSPRILTLADLPTDCNIIIDFIHIVLVKASGTCSTQDGNALRLYRGSDNHLIYKNRNANVTLLPPPLIINTTLADYIRIEFVIPYRIGGDGFLLKHYSKKTF